MPERYSRENDLNNFDWWGKPPQLARPVTYVDNGEGGQIAIEQRGNPEGDPVIALHGTPGSRVGPWPRHIAMWRMGVNLIAFDRDGYGGSTRNEGRSVADVAKRVEAIMDHLEI